MQPYTLSPKFLVIHDRPKSPSLGALFQDSHTMFKMRVQHLGNMSRVTTDEDSETLRLMLDALIAAKKCIQEKA